MKSAFTPIRTRRISPWIPIAASFGVYLIPLVGPNAVWLVGEALMQELTDGGRREPLWTAADAGLALLAQVGVGVLAAWTMLGSRARLLAWIAAIPALVAVLNAAMLVAIPSYFLIERDTMPELSTWARHCFVPDATLMSIRTPIDRSDGAREWWMQRPDGRYVLLTVPGCTLVDASVPTPTLRPGGGVDFTLGFHFLAPGGATLVERLIPMTSARSWWVLPAPSAMLTEIQQPDLVEGAPVLSDTADAVGWIQREEGTGPPFLHRVVVLPLHASAGRGRTDIDLAPFGAASYTLLEVDTVGGQVRLWRNDEPVSVGFGGERRDTGFKPGAVRAQASTYLRMNGGWVAWDAYRDEGAYQLAWSLPGGAGTHRTNKGRSVSAAAVDPSGRFVAISESTTLSIGDAPDVVYVIRASDGADVFRTYLPRYARSQVVFFQGGFFAYSDLTGTHVLEVSR